ETLMKGDEVDPRSMRPSTARILTQAMRQAKTGRGSPPEESLPRPVRTGRGAPRGRRSAAGKRELSVLPQERPCMTRLALPRLP
ncbi:MAG: hypothetical protein ACK5V1_12850, partial [Planctomycetaceae bacterium]